MQDLFLKYRQQGATLMELMVVIAIMAILTVVAVPAYNSFVANSQSQSIATQLAASLRYAYTEAITRGYDIYFCPTVTANTVGCGTSNWRKGWQVVDSNTNAALEMVGTTGSGSTGSGSLIISSTTISASPAITEIIMHNNGFNTAAPTSGTITFTIKPTGCSGSAGGRVVTWTPSGYVYIASVSCP